MKEGDIMEISKETRDKVRTMYRAGYNVVEIAKFFRLPKIKVEKIINKMKKK
jgi:hypothetical protein